MKPAELAILLAGEIERHLPTLRGSDVRSSRASLHALRGSAAMAGQVDLAMVIGHLSARLRSGDASAAMEAAELLEDALGQLRSGQMAFPVRFPEPPPGLGVSALDPTYKGEYVAAVRERMGELAALADEHPRASDALGRAIRAVHSIKGAAGAVGDDAMAWYCHGVEAELKAAVGRERDEVALRDLVRHTSVIALLLEDPSAALETLRRTRRTSPPGIGRRPSAPPALEEETGEHTVRVQGVSLDRVLERLERIALVHDDLAGTASRSHDQSARLRELRSQLLDALRMLGPPRPWGPPAAALDRVDRVARALSNAAEDSDVSSATCRSGAERLLGATRDIRQEISHARRTTLSHLLGRVATGIERLATREGRALRVLVAAPDVPVDREIAERLVDPLMQLARNALAHGLEREDERLARGKNPTGSLLLSGERVGDTLRISCEDDGRGVDIDLVRRLAVERGLIGAEAARAAGDDDLLALLFVPGVTTREDADLLAGRGVGLDLAQSMVRRLGGAIRLHRRRTCGLLATIDVPAERWMTDVLWVGAGPWELAIPVAFTGKLSQKDRSRPAVHLARCLGEATDDSAPLSLELALGGAPIVSVGIDRVGEVEECSLRPLPALVASAGPFSGAILRGDGGLRLALDAALVAVRAWALA